MRFAICTAPQRTTWDWLLEVWKPERVEGNGGKLMYLNKFCTEKRHFPYKSFGSLCKG